MHKSMKKIFSCAGIRVHVCEKFFSRAINCAGIRIQYMYCMHVRNSSAELSTVPAYEYIFVRNLQQSYQLCRYTDTVHVLHACEKFFCRAINCAGIQVHACEKYFSKAINSAGIRVVVFEKFFSRAINCACIRVHFCEKSSAELSTVAAYE